MNAIRGGRKLKKAAPVKKEEKPLTGRDAFLAQIRMTRQNKNLKKVDKAKVEAERERQRADTKGGGGLMSDVMQAAAKLRMDIHGDDSDDDDSDSDFSD